MFTKKSVAVAQRFCGKFILKIIVLFLFISNNNLFSKNDQKNDEGKGLSISKIVEKTISKTLSNKTLATELLMKESKEIDSDLTQNDLKTPKLDIKILKITDPLHQIERLQKLLRLCTTNDSFRKKKIERSLGLTIDQLIRKIKINIDRWKSVTDSFADKFLIINIPSYMLYAIENGELEFTQKIVVGKVKRKTPVFQSYITRVIFNPSWTVPPTIFFEDKLPRIRRDPSYLKRANYIVRNSKGVIVDPRKVNWKAVSRNRMSYSIRKLPGSDNPLGQIKFEIANSNGIFMHGTSQENLFNSESRPFSSGCVRVEDPIELAAWVLNEDKDYIKDRIDREKTASLQSDAFPIIFSYITLWVDDLNEVFISEDPYDKF